ncbi:MAG: helix-turn-helix domain-containing protein [Flammeovirgaceae bacterium]|nr:helix-turn-helix domain-containing protein [Flammeovirgaceae bacterium]
MINNALLDLNWINLLILFGALQSLIFGTILLFNKKHPGAKFLSIFIFVIAYNGFETFNWSSQLDQYHLFFNLFPFVTICALGPSLYLYIHSLIYPNKDLNLKAYIKHYYPFLFQFIFRISMIGIYILGINDFFFTKTQMESLDNLYFYYAEVLSVFVFLVYLIKSIRLFARGDHKRSLFTKGLRLEIHNWIKALLICMVVLGVAWPITIIIPHFINLPQNIHYYPLEIFLVIFIYWIAFAGYFRTKLIYKQSPKTSPTTITASDANQFMKKLRMAMEVDRLYLNPDLNLSKLAEHTEINVKNISAILNQHFNQSFNDFINHYRVQEVCERLLSQENQHLTISGIALESGFNSQATFQRAFKNTKRMSPRQFSNKYSNGK